MLPKWHPWHHRLERDHNVNFNSDQFAKKWLLDLDEVDLTLPSIAVINGWGATHEKNGWLAKALSGGISSMFAYDSRGQGGSMKDGDLDSIQGAIDAQRLIADAFKLLDGKAAKEGIQPGNKVLEGHCLGAMTIAALYAGKFGIADEVKGNILISPTSSFNLPLVAKISYFFPTWLGSWLADNYAETLAKIMLSGDESENSRQEGISRIRSLDMGAVLRQVKQIFWKEDVSKLWKYIDKPTMLLVSDNDPLVTLEESIDVWEQLPYPIWVQLEAPDHFILEDNIGYLSELVPRFCSDPWKVFDEMKDVRPSR